MLSPMTQENDIFTSVIGDPVIFSVFVNCAGAPPGGGGTPYNGLYGETPPERGTFFRLEVYKR